MHREWTGHALIVDDDLDIVQSLRDALDGWASRVSEANSVAQAIDALHARPDLILLDVSLPDGSGVRVAEHAAGLRPMPRIIAMSGSASASEAFKLSQVGAMEYLSKPFSAGALTRALEKVLSSVPELTLARQDTLTGLQNRRGGEEALARELASARQTGQALGVALFDIDHFKRINDNFGHAMGDRVLRAVSDAMSKCMRRADIAVRWGGDELLTILPTADLPKTRELAERARHAVEQLRLEELPLVTVSAGTSELVPADEDAGILFLRADAQLYAAKASGRNTVR